MKNFAIIVSALGNEFKYNEMKGMCILHDNKCLRAMKVVFLSMKKKNLLLKSTLLNDNLQLTQVI